MAVQKSKCTRRRRGNRRSHHGLKHYMFGESESGLLHRLHHLASDNTYRDRKLIIENATNKSSK